MGPCAGVDYNLTLCPLQSRFQHIYSTMGNPIPESTLTLCQSRLYPPSQGLWIWPLGSVVFKECAKIKTSNVYTGLPKLLYLVQLINYIKIYLVFVQLHKTPGLLSFKGRPCVFPIILKIKLKPFFSSLP
jgi:hypothetical protein